MIRYIFVYLIFILISLKANVTAQDMEPNKNDISHEVYEELKEEVKLKKTKREVKPFEPKEKEEEEKEEKDFEGLNFPSLGITGDIFKLIAFALIFLLVGGILFLIFGNIEIEKKAEEREYNHEDEIEDISDIDAETEYEKALRQGDYRLALRMKFIAILQILSSSKLIDWKNEKTNRHYLRELSTTDYYSNFRKSANVYEYYWYGNNQIDQAIFEQSDQDFELFLSKLRHE